MTKLAPFFLAADAVRERRGRRPYAGRHRPARMIGDGERGSSGDRQLVPLGDPHRVPDDLIPGGDLNARDDDPNIRRI